MKVSNQSTTCALLGALGLAFLAPTAMASSVTINSKTFDLDQFTGAAVTYRDEAGSNVTFDGKLWDNFVGVDGVTLGELASVQAGGDPGDQVSLNSTPDPDWLVLTYGSPLTLAADSEFVVFEITSSSSGVDPEGLNWKIGFNGNPVSAVTSAQVSHFPSPGGGVEDTNMGVFSLSDMGLSVGDTLTSIRIENLFDGQNSGAYDPDFIFAGLTTSGTVIPTPSAFVLGGLGLGALVMRRRTRI